MTVPVALVFAAAGCNRAPSAPDPAVVAEQRERLLLAEEPEGAVTPLDLREQEGGVPEGPVVLVGQIGGVPNPWKEAEPEFPWKAGQAAFFLVDPGAAADYADHSQGDPDHAESCPFCASHAADNASAVAAVNFAGPAGGELAIGARELLALEENAVVVVRGQVRLAGDLLIVEADGLYVRE